MAEDGIPVRNFPEIVVERDYDGYFEAIVNDMVNNKEGEFKHSRIVVNAGPWRPDAVTCQSMGDTIRLDFYSPLRVGFGSLSDGELAQVTERL